VTFLLALLALMGASEPAEVRVGRSAPPITLRQVLQAPDSAKTNWESLSGTAVVLEFWATLCPGCRDQISHLNRLAEEFKGKPVRFISITDEEPDIVQRFLRDYGMLGWVGLDSGGATFRRYGIVGRPQAVLVDATGVVRGIGSPADLTGETIEGLLKGQPIAFSSEASVKLQSLPDPLFEVMVRPAAPADVVGYSSGAVSGQNGKTFEMWGVNLPTILSEAYGIPAQRIEAPGWGSESTYDVALADSDLTPARHAELLQRALETTFRLKVHKETRDTAVYVLQRIPGATPMLSQAASTSTRRWGKNGDITAVSMSMAGLANFSARTLERPVFDETGIQGHYDFGLKWDAGNHRSFIEALRKQLCLDLVESHRPLDYLVVESALPPRTW